MAVHRELQANYRDEFPVTTPPMTSPYDLPGTMQMPLLDAKPLASPYYFPYTLLAYNQVYGITDQLSDFLKFLMIRQLALCMIVI